MGIERKTALRTKPLLGTARFNNFYNSGSQGLNGGDVVGKNTHVTSCSRNVDLNNVRGCENGLENGSGQAKV